MPEMPKGHEARAGAQDETASPRHQKTSEATDIVLPYPELKALFERLTAAETRAAVAEAELRMIREQNEEAPDRAETANALRHLPRDDPRWTAPILIGVGLALGSFGFAIGDESQAGVFHGFGLVLASLGLYRYSVVRLGRRSRAAMIVTGFLILGGFAFVILGVTNTL